MLKHVVAFRFKSDVPDQLKASIVSELNSFPERFTVMRNWTLGPNISRRDDRFSHAFVVEFESEKDLVEYLDSTEHEEFVAKRFRPYIQERMIITLES